MSKNKHFKFTDNFLRMIFPTSEKANQQATEQVTEQVKRQIQRLGNEVKSANDLMLDLDLIVVYKNYI